MGKDEPSPGGATPDLLGRLENRELAAAEDGRPPGRGCMRIVTEVNEADEVPPGALFASFLLNFDFCREAGTVESVTLKGTRCTQRNAGAGRLGA